MASDLELYVDSALLVDTHNHLRTEDDWVDRGPDILEDLFVPGALRDLAAAGAPLEALERLLDTGERVWRSA